MIKANEIDYASPTGYTAQQIAEQARAVFMTCTAVEQQISWEEATEAVRDNWETGVDAILAPIAGEVETRWETLARTMAMGFHGEDRWDDLASPLRLAWEAAARTTANYMTAVDELDLRDIQEFQWDRWMMTRLGG